MLPVLFAIPGLVFVIGLAALAAGLRGKRCNDHPICRKCKFDLFGNPTADTCPECGGELKRKRAVRIGERRKRRWLIFVAVLLLLGGTGGLGGSGYVAAKEIDWQEVKPVWWLRREANGAPSPASNAALSELARRHAKSKLSANQVQALVSDALVFQANRNRPWQFGWGDIIERARKNGNLCDELWRTYAANAIDANWPLTLRPRTRIGDPFAYKHKYLSSRVGLLCPLQVREHTCTFSVNGVNVKRYDLEDFGMGVGQGVDVEGHMIADLESIEPLEPGRADVQMIIDLTVVEYDRKSSNGSILATIQSCGRGTTDIVPAGQPTAAFINESEMTEELSAAVRDAVSLQRLERERYYRRAQNYLPLDIRIDKLPVDTAFDVIANLDGVEVELDSIAHRAGKIAVYHAGGKVPPDWKGRKIDIILRPSLNAAVRTVDVFKIWGGADIVFEDAAALSDGK